MNHHPDVDVLSLKKELYALESLLKSNVEERVRLDDAKLHCNRARSFAERMVEGVRELESHIAFLDSEIARLKKPYNAEVGNAISVILKTFGEDYDNDDFGFR